MSRLDPIRGRSFDVAVIGGGVIGAGIARDAALRGISVALFEKFDYASGTTSGSTRLIHGGLRYLEMLDIRLVRMDLRERETLLRIAPHLVKPLEFLVPFYDSSLWHRLRMRAGMLLYDLLSFDKSLPNHRMLNARETLKAEPALRAEGLQGAASYFDAQIESPERLTVENITDARANGAHAFNYAEVLSASRDGGRDISVRVRDALDGDEIEVRARVVVNAAGPWLDRVARLIEPGALQKIRTTKGIHLACPPTVGRAVVLFSVIDKRLMFVIPLRGFSWVSTTDADFEDDPSTASAAKADIDYLMRSAAEYVPALQGAEVFWTNAGVRALVRQAGGESSVSRSHTIESEPGFVSVLGGKITGYRAIAEEATDAVAKQLGIHRPCITAQQSLPGTKSAAEEQCVHLADYMMRRTSLSFTQDRGRSLVDDVAANLETELGWSNERRSQEIQEYVRQI